MTSKEKKNWIQFHLRLKYNLNKSEFDVLDLYSSGCINDNVMEGKEIYERIKSDLCENFSFFPISLMILFDNKAMNNGGKLRIKESGRWRSSEYHTRGQFEWIELFYKFFTILCGNFIGIELKSAKNIQSF